ncbi:hypothetical protein GCM10023347_08490 [Streptomyces chumphonensis]
MLRELKERSGHSYGFLAKRLHMSTSTLHRYCHGVAVPADYAPVERLARLCDATPEETARLFRRWQAADAARSAPATTAASPAPGRHSDADVPDDAPDPVPVHAPEASDTARPDGAAPDSAPDAETARSDTAPPDTAQADTAQSDTARSDTAQSDTAQSDTTPPGAGARPARSPRRRAVWLAVAVALALVVVSALVALVRAADSGAADTAAPGAPSGPAGAPGDDAGAPGQRPPGGAPESGTPAADATRPGATEPGGTTSPHPPGGEAGPSRPDGGGPREGDGPTPLTVTTRSHVWAGHCDHRYLIDPGTASPTDVPAPPVEQDAADWATGVAAVHGGRTNVEVTVQGVGDATVVLRDLHVRVVDRRAPPPWSVYAMSPGCGGALTPARFTVDLDADRPLAQPVDGYDAEGPGRTLPATRFPVTVSAADPQVLRVEASASRCDCDWYLELEWSAGGREGVLRVAAAGSAGRPFRTSGAEGRPVYVHEEGRGWTREE